jgi:hypothetical protein
MVCHAHLKRSKSKSGKLIVYKGNALAAIGMGIYYTLAAAQENRTFFKLTVPMRMLTSVVFWGQGGGWRIAGLWEGGGAVLTAVALIVG